MNKGLIFDDRPEAGRRLAAALSTLGPFLDPLVLALPRGGVPVGYEVARALRCPLDLLLVRKLGLPAQPELAMGAIASGGIRVLNPEMVRGMGVSEETLQRVSTEEVRELDRRERAYRGDRPPPDVRGRTVILVDDGAATGSTLEAGVRALRERGPARIVVAVPTAPADVVERLGALADAVVCLTSPEPFLAVGLSYRDFHQMSDAEVVRLLDGDAPPPEGAAGGAGDLRGQ